jgi:hypothetical protein
MVGWPGFLEGWKGRGREIVVDIVVQFFIQDPSPCDTSLLARIVPVLLMSGYKSLYFPREPARAFGRPPPCSGSRLRPFSELFSNWHIDCIFNDPREQQLLNSFLLEKAGFAPPKPAFSSSAVIKRLKWDQFPTSSLRNRCIESRKNSARSRRNFASDGWCRYIIWPAA